MRILYIAYSCDPYNGSEDKIGWNVPITCSRHNKVYVITKREHEKTIKKYLEVHPLNNIEYYFVDIPAFYKKIFRGFLYSGRLNVWNHMVMPIARRICKEKRIQIIHQITPIEFRAIGNYGRISGIKFVCGPLGGGESMPNALRVYSSGHEKEEFMRFMINNWHRIKFRLTGKLRYCDYIMFANRETLDFLRGGV